MGVITTLAVTTAAVVGTAVVKRNAQKKAAEAQKKAITQQENLLRKKLDPGALNRLAQQVDRERALNRVALQQEVDPEIAALRDFSKKQLLQIAQQDPSSQQSQRVANQLFEENIKADPQMERLKDTIIGRAQEDFDAGATLPAEFQAELVRTGIQTGGQAGVGTAGRTVGGVTSRLLGSAGVALKQQRAQEGAALAGVADGLARSRQQLLSSIFPTVKVQEDAKYGRAVQGLGIAEGMLPESGLTGNAAVDVEIARRKGQANLIGQRGQIAAQDAASRGEMTASLIGAGAGAVTGGINAYGALSAANSAATSGGIDYTSLSRDVIGSGQPNPYYGLSPGLVPYSYKGDPNLLVSRRTI